MDMSQILKGAIARNTDRIANVKEDQLDDPAIGDWKVRDLVNHLIGGNFLYSMLHEGTTPDYTTLRTPDFIAQGNPSETYASSGETNVAGWQVPGALEKEYPLPFGAMPGSGALRIALTEAVVHGWDLAKATGQDATIPDELAAPMLSGFKQMLPPTGRPPQMPFADAVPIAEDAPLGDQLVAYLGRTP